MDSNQTAEIFSMIRSGELRPLKQMVNLYGANLNCKYISGYTPLMEAVALDSMEFVEYICKTVKEKSKDTHTFLKYINAPSSNGQTALIIATLCNTHTKIIEYLIAQGVKPQNKDLHGKMAKDYGSYAVSEEVEDFWASYVVANIE